MHGEGRRASEASDASISGTGGLYSTAMLRTFGLSSLHFRHVLSFRDSFSVPCCNAALASSPPCLMRLHAHILAREESLACSAPLLLVSHAMPFLPVTARSAALQQVQQPMRAMFPCFSVFCLPQ